MYRSCRCGGHFFTRYSVRAQVMQKLAKAGLPADAPQFFAAHSLGTVFLQDFVAQRQPAPAGQVSAGGWPDSMSLCPRTAEAP